MSGVFRAGGFAVLVAVVAASGCADKLRYEKTFTLPEEGHPVKVLTLPQQSAEQTLKVEVQSDQPVDVYVFSGQDAPDLESTVPKEWEAKAITSKKGVTTETLTAKVPAKQESKVVIALGVNTDKAQVTVKMTN